MSADDIERLVAKYVTPEQVAEWRDREAAEQDTEDQPARPPRGQRARRPKQQASRRGFTAAELEDLARKYPAMRL